MNQNLILFSSITYASKARDYLFSRGITAHLLKTPSQFTQRTCGYSLHLPKGNAVEAAQMLNRVQIKTLGTTSYN